MVHKIRKVMVNFDSRYTLEGMIEMEEECFTLVYKEVKPNKSKSGRGAVDKQSVIISAKSTPLEEPETDKKSKHVRYFKIKILDNHKDEEVNNHLSESIDEKSIVFIDKSTSYVDVAKYLEMYITYKTSKKSTEETLCWVYIFIINVKRNLLGNYHEIKGKYLQLYHNKFLYKLNRWYFRVLLFNSVVVAAICV